MLYHSMLKFHLIDLVVVEISRHEVYSGSLLEGGCAKNTWGCTRHSCVTLATNDDRLAITFNIEPLIVDLAV